jgi:Limonene-1,2-epoxide hydrolase catalytic domain
MADQLAKQGTGGTSAQVADTLLYSLRDDHYDARAAALDDDVINHNVGLPMVRGRHRSAKFLRRVRTERTDVITHGPLDHRDRYQQVLYRGLVRGRSWSRPFRLNVWTAAHAKYGCIYVLETPHDSSGNGYLHCTRRVNSCPGQ